MIIIKKSKNRATRLHLDAPKDSGNIPYFTCHIAIDLNIHWPFYKLHCNFGINYLPEYENHWPGASGHCILGALRSEMYLHSKSFRS